jgi:hypothetical protein
MPGPRRKAFVGGRRPIDPSPLPDDVRVPTGYMARSWVAIKAAGTLARAVLALVMLAHAIHHD